MEFDVGLNTTVLAVDQHGGVLSRSPQQARLRLTCYLVESDHTALALSLHSDAIARRERFYASVPLACLLSMIVLTSETIPLLQHGPLARLVLWALLFYALGRLAWTAWDRRKSRSEETIEAAFRRLTSRSETRVSPPAESHETQVAPPPATGTSATCPPVEDQRMCNARGPSLHTGGLPRGAHTF